MSALRPMPGIVIVRPIQEGPEVTASGIVVVTRRRTSADRGKVVAVAPDVDCAAVGDTVLYGSGSGEPLAFEGDKLRALNHLELVGVLV